MDAFELIRASAAEFHEELVAKGANPTNSLALAKAAAAHLGYEITFLSVGDPALKGARALLDEQLGEIRCEDSGSDAHKAELIAHELGHDKIHGGSSSCSADDINASQSMEAAPVGLQRVEDYGVRERRELQANVFAREFLFPRSLARLMFNEEKRSASDIAKLTGLPLSLVRQQIFDAMLLPPFVEEAPKPKPVFKTDPVQVEAAKFRDAPYQLQAGPGTGKTRTLVERLVSLVGEQVDPASILVLTFSNRAAAELAERVAAVLPEAAPKIWIGTFHSFGLDVLRRHGDVLGLPSDPALFDRSDAIAVLEDILPTLPLKHFKNLWDPLLDLREVLGAISRAKDEVADFADYRRLALKMREKAADEKSVTHAEKCLEVADIFEHYETAKRERGAVDFGDLVMLPALLLEKDAGVAATVQLRHRHILVDEYQDVNRASVRLLKALAGDGKRLWVVGDARQSIYRFRGASSGNMAAFAKDFPGAKSNQLGISYRSTQKVVDSFTALSATMSASEGMLPLKLKAERGTSNVKPEIRRFATPDAELEGIAAGIVELLKDGVPFREQAVLCRTNSKLNDVALALEARGIPVLHLGSIFERDDIRDLLALLSLAIDPFGDGLARVGAMPRYNLSMQDVYVATRKLRESNTKPIEGLSKICGEGALSSAGSTSLKRLAKDFADMRSEMTAWELLSRYLLDKTDVVREFASDKSVSGWMRCAAIWQFLNFVREQSPVGGGYPIRRTLERIRQLVLLAEERDLRQVPASALGMDAVRLMTVHGSKGLEFEAVHVPGLTKESFPGKYRGQRVPAPEGLIEGAALLSVDDEAKRSHKEEEECLFFVAMSRARTHLQLYLSRTQANGNNRSPSPFIEALGNLANENADPSVLPLPENAPRSQPILVKVGTQHTTTDSRLGMYKRCPRRFFYTHLLALGGAKKATPFALTHSCIYEWMKALRALRVQGPVDAAIAEKAFEEIWKSQGPLDHAFVAEYRALAARIVSAMLKFGDGTTLREPETIAISFADGSVVVEPDEIVQLTDGTIVLRRVRTGYRRSDEYESVNHIEYALYIAAGRQKYGASSRVDAVHLTDESHDPVELTDRVMKNRREDVAKMLSGISSGHFPTKPDTMTCARCPHFFVCAATPVGDLTLN